MVGSHNLVCHFHTVSLQVSRRGVRIGGFISCSRVCSEMLIEIGIGIYGRLNMLVCACIAEMRIKIGMIPVSSGI